jgi:hypothetical protein
MKTNLDTAVERFPALRSPGDVVLLEREEITHLKDGRTFTLPVMDSFKIRDGTARRNGGVCRARTDLGLHA